MLRQLRLMLKITRSHGIMRRYFIVNGFDGALTMLGLIIGFYVSQQVEMVVIFNACLGAAVALGMSGLSSAYVSEAAEKQKELHDLEQAMIHDLEDSAYGQAARFLPWVIGAVNSLSPLIISFAVISPIWFTLLGFTLPLNALLASMALAMLILFLFGVFLGQLSGTFWLWSGLRTLLVALATGGVIFLVAPG